MGTRNNDPTNGRVYGGDTGLIHIADGERKLVGASLGMMLDETMRQAALARGDRTREEAESQDLCPGCYMVALFNAAVFLAQQNGQSLDELGRTMADAFESLTDRRRLEVEDRVLIESIEVRIDKDGAMERSITSRIWSLLSWT